jgi:membrane protease YdiL (CAAX protease family)
MAPSSSPPRFWTRVLLPIAAVPGSLVLAIVVYAALRAAGVGDTNTAAIATVIAELGLLIAGVVIVRLLAPHERRLVLDRNGSRAAGLGLGVAMGLGLVIASGIVIALGTVVDGGLEDRLKDQAITLPDSPWALGLMVIALVVLAPLAEELLFRGLLFRSLARRLPIAGAIAISSILFAASHADAYLLWPRAIALALTGAGLAWLYMRRGYWASVSAHATVNAVAAGALLATG